MTGVHRVRAEGLFGPRVEEIVTYLSAGTNVHLIGLAGSGRGRLLELVEPVLEAREFTVLRVHPVEAWREEPFAALYATGVLGAGAGAKSPAPRNGGEMALALADRLRGQKTVVICDDLELLDRQSAGALVAVAHKVPLTLLTSGAYEDASTARDVVGSAPAVRLRVPPLNLFGVDQVCQDILGGSLDAETLARIALKSGGMYGLVCAVAYVGLQTGLLVRDSDEEWTAPGSLWTDELVPSIDPLVAGLTEQEREVLALLAAYGPLQLAHALERFDAGALRRLAALGVVRISYGREALVGVYPPLLGEYMKRQPSAAGLAVIHNLAYGQVPVQMADGASALPAPQAGEDGLLGEAFLASVPEFVTDAFVVNQRLSRDLECVLARSMQEWRAEPSSATLLPLLQALRSASVSASQVYQVLNETTWQDGTLPGVLVLAWYAIWLANDLNHVENALEILARYEETFPDHRGLLLAVRAHIAFLRDRVNPEVASGDIVQLSATGEAGTQFGQLVYCEALLARGQVHRALAELEKIESGDNAALVAQKHVLTLLARIFSGEIAEVKAATDIAVATVLSSKEAASPAVMQSNAYVALVGLLLEGRLEEVAQISVDALSVRTVAAFHDIYHLGVVSLSAEIAALQGRTVDAQAMALRATSARAGRGPYPGMVPEALGWFIDVPASSDDPWASVEECFDRGYDLTGLCLALWAAEHGTPGPKNVKHAERAARVAAAMEGSLLPAMGEYAVAVTAADVVALRELSLRFQDLGAALYATRAAVALAMQYRRDGDARAAAQAADVAWEASAAAGQERVGFFQRLVQDIALSPREIEVLRCVSEGKTPAEISVVLQGSVRTIETHIHNVGRKIGIPIRAQMGRAARTWLRDTLTSEQPTRS